MMRFEEQKVTDLLKIRHGFRSTVPQQPGLDRVHRTFERDRAASSCHLPFNAS